MAVAFGAVGPGIGITTNAGSYAHTPGASDNYVVLGLSVATNVGGSYTSYTRTVTYGGVAMTSLGAIDKNNSTSGWVELFGVAITPGAGAKTVSVTVTNNFINEVRANTVSYSGVVSVGTAATAFGSSSVGAISNVASASGHMVVNAIAFNSTGSPSFTSYTQTSRYNSASGAYPLEIGDAAGASTVSFSSNFSNSGVWGAIAVDLSPTSVVAFGATGAGNSTTTVTSGTITTSWSHTKAVGDNCAVVAVACSGGGAAPSTFTRTATYGGVPMVSLGVMAFANSTTGWVELFAVGNPAGGAQTVIVTVTKSGATYTMLRGNSVSYSGVGGFAAAVTNNGTATALSSGSVTSALGSMVVQAFAANIAGGGITSYNQTARYNQTAGFTTPMAFGDAAGAATVSFTATGSSSQAYGSVAVNLIPSATNYENTTLVTGIIPANATGCYATLIGAGGAGGKGVIGSSGARAAAGGGGGGGKINRVFIPFALLGGTYSVVQGTGGVGGGSNGTAGGASTFSSGSVSLSAGGGAGGLGNGSTTAGVGGTCSASGVAPTTLNGTDGGAGGGAGLGTAAANNATGSAAGGGGGGPGITSNGLAGGKGGDSATVTGGAAGAAFGNGGTPSNAAAGNGGAGGGGGGGGSTGVAGAGGLYGGGGGGGPGGSGGGTGGAGGDGYSLVEWITSVVIPTDLFFSMF